MPGAAAGLLVGSGRRESGPLGAREAGGRGTSLLVRIELELGQGPGRAASKSNI